MEQILKELEELKNQVIFSRECDQSHSMEMDKLFTALSKAQEEIGLAEQNSKNPFFKSKYADLSSIVKASRKALCKNGLCVIQQILSGKDAMYLHTKLGHSSGQWVESRVKLTPKNSEPQSLGSYLSYLKRYSYAAIIGVVTADEDDDAEQAMGRTTREVSPFIVKEQVEQLENELLDVPDLLQEILSKMKIKTLSDMPKDKFLAALKRIREIKDARESA